MSAFALARIAGRRHPRLATPLTVSGTFAAALASVLAAVTAR